MTTLCTLSADATVSKKSMSYKPHYAEHDRCLTDGSFCVGHLDGTTAGKRPVGICFVDGIELNRFRIQTGHARDCQKFSGGRYPDDELAARRSGHHLQLIYELPPYCGPLTVRALPSVGGCSACVGRFR